MGRATSPRERVAKPVAAHLARLTRASPIGGAIGLDEHIHTVYKGMPLFGKKPVILESS
jgi:hypothetical protein